MSKITFLVWTLVILIINEDASGDVTFVEESKRFKLSLPDLPDDRNINSNNLGFRDTVLDFLKRKLGVRVSDQKPSRNKNRHKTVKTQSQINPTQLVHSSKKKDVTKDFKTANNGPLQKKCERSVADFQKSNLDGNVLVLSFKMNDDTNEKNGEKGNDGTKHAESIEVESKIGRKTSKVKHSQPERRGCKEGSYTKRDCNVCMCMEGSWNCTSVVCNHGPVDPKKFKILHKLNVDATDCIPGDEVEMEDNKDCPCKCMLPSVMVCDICPAVDSIKKPGKNRNHR